MWCEWLLLYLYPCVHNGLCLLLFESLYSVSYTKDTYVTVNCGNQSLPGMIVPAIDCNICTDDKILHLNKQK